jgi:hypothetical protein
MEPPEPISKAAKPKRPLEILRERRGGMSKELKEYFNAQQRVKKAIRAALATGPKTVPQIAGESGTPPADVLWHVMAMRRYGEVVDGAEQDGYVLYRLKGA